MLLRSCQFLAHLEPTPLASCMMMSSQVALEVAQQAISVLVEWASASLPTECQPKEENGLHPAVRRAKKILSWPESKLPDCLHLLFDFVKLSDEQSQEPPHYCPAVAIANNNPIIPYPKKEPPVLEDLKQQVKQALENLNQEDWQNLSLLTLILEKFGSCLSFGESDVALIDMARATGAVAAALASHPEASELRLVAGDLSGIQKFIYTISSDGALKSLRARSFYLELVTEEVVQQLLAALDLPRSNVIYAGGGNLYLLAAATDRTKDSVHQVHQRFNEWLLKEFQGKVFLALDCVDFPIVDVGTQRFSIHWTDATKQLAGQKSQKFAEQLSQLLEIRDSHELCRVCHRDDVKPENLKPLNEDDSVLACGTCRRMFQLGGQLLRVKAIVRSQDGAITKYPIYFNLSSGTIYYHLFNSDEKVSTATQNDTVFLVNSWATNDYKSGCNTLPLLLGNYAKESEIEPGSISRAGELAAKAQGIKRLGYLRMDVDRLGQIFAKGLGKNQTLPRLSALSRQMSYFFKVYLNSLAENRLENLPKSPKKVKTLTQEPRSNLVFIYAGGDDLFVSGAWNEIVEFAFDVYQCFRVYTGRNPDITLSGGISLADVKFPLYQAAYESGDAEDAAKGNGRDSLGLFGQVFKWGEWLGSKDDSDSISGVLPIVSCLKAQQLEVNIARSFVRNLLITAQMQDHLIKEREEQIKKINEKQQEQIQYKHFITRIEQEKQDIRYYLHLPKVAYAIARLPKQVREHNSFKPVQISLMTPDNAPYFRAIATWIELLNRS